MEQRAARRDTIDERVRLCLAQVALEPTEPWVIWCELNAEQDALAKALGDDCASVYGSLNSDEKERRLLQFVAGEKRILLSKQSICGWGINLQRSARMAFVGISNSWESYHQAVRRCWRFGQKRAVHVHLFASELEGNVARNLQRKEREAELMAEELSRETAEMVRAEVVGQVRRTNAYTPPTINLPSWMKGAGT
jgi:superfamily II DNA/RNA helicase